MNKKLALLFCLTTRLLKKTPYIGKKAMLWRETACEKTGKISYVASENYIIWEE